MRFPPAAAASSRLWRSAKLGRGLHAGSRARAGLTHHHHSTAFLSATGQLNLALVILNVDGAARLGSSGGRLTHHLWREAGVRVCADGAANRLHDALDGPERSRVLPTLILGDLDSAPTGLEPGITRDTSEPCCHIHT